MSEVVLNRQQLIEGCQGLVRSLAWAIHRGLPDTVELDDLIAYGQVGLAEAARDFDATRGLKFSTYAYHRVRGAIYDGLSKMTWFSRSQYQRLRFAQRANDLLGVENESGTDPSVTRTEEDGRWLSRMAGGLAVAYLATHVHDDSEQASLADADTPAPPTVAIDRETTERLHQLIDGLPPDAGVLIRATYFEGLTLQEAGRRLGISKAWASRLHAKTLDRLARALRRIGLGIEC